MARGAPDFWQFEDTSQYAAQGALGELAARLAPIAAFDRRGDLLWRDGFEAGLRAWDKAGSPAGHTETLTTTFARVGGYSAQLSPNASANATARIFHTAQGHASGRLGFEIHLSLDSQNIRPRISHVVWTGTQRVEWAIRIDATAGSIEYLDSDGNWQTLTTDVDIATTVGLFQPFKLVGSLADQEYLRLVHAFGEEDMSNIVARVTTVTTTASSEITIEAEDQVGDGINLYVDSATLTVNEPA